MNTRTPDENRIRRRIAEIDQHISVLMKEREELVFADRVIDRLREPPDVTSTPAASLTSDSHDPESIEDALLMLESKAGVHTNASGGKSGHW